MPPPQRRLSRLSRDESLRRLASTPMGRLIFTMAGLPAVRPVNHAVADDAVIIRTHLGSGTSLAEGMVVAYEADLIDPDTHSGWSVVVTGRAWFVTEPTQIERYEAVVHSWVAQDMTHVLRIDTDLVTGFELASDEARSNVG